MSNQERACKVGTPLEKPEPKTTAFRTRIRKSIREVAVSSHGLPCSPACFAASCSKLLQFPDFSHSQPPLLDLHVWQFCGSHHALSRSSFLNFFFHRLAMSLKPTYELGIRLS